MLELQWLRFVHTCFCLFVCPFRSCGSSPVYAMDREYPDEADGYELLEACGRGVSATVWRAKCKPFGDIVAVKLLDLESLNCKIEEVIHEAQTMCMYHHPNVLSLHTSFVSGKHLWLVMPYMPGGSVLNIMRYKHPQGLDEITIAIIMKEVVKGLEYVHKGGGIHRDVKAGNILVGLDGTVKIADFGVAATMERGGSWGNDRRGRETFVGTPCWMAPEVMEQVGEYNNKADIWSLGITFMELARGQAPFAKYPPMKVLLMTLQNPPPQLDDDQTGQRFSKHMRDLVCRCLQKDPSKRPTASQILESKFFKGIPDTKYLTTHLLKGLPPLTERVRQQDQNKLKGRVETHKQGNESKGVSAWDFDIPALKQQAAREPPILEVPSPIPSSVSSQREFDSLKSSIRTGSAETLQQQTHSAIPEQRLGEAEGGLGEVSTSRPPSETYGSDRGDLPSSPLSGSVGSPSANLGHQAAKSGAFAEATGNPTSNEYHAKSEPVIAGNFVNGQKKVSSSKKEKKLATSSRFVMLDEDAEKSVGEGKNQTPSVASPRQSQNTGLSISGVSSGALLDEAIQLAASVKDRPFVESQDDDAEPEKVVHQKVGRFEVGFKKEPSSKNLAKSGSAKDISDIGKAPAYVPPATALLPRMMEMMEHFKDHYNAMQQMVDVVGEADRGKALALQKFLAQPLTASKPADHIFSEDHILDLERKIRSLEAENQKLKERNAFLEKQSAGFVTANGPRGHADHPNP